MAAAAAAGGARLSYPNIGLQNHPAGTAQFKEGGVEWVAGGRGAAVKEFLKGDLASLGWTIFGSKGYLKISLKEGKSAKLDGFQKADFDPIAEYCRAHYDMELTKDKVENRAYAANSQPPLSHPPNRPRQA